jgi:hypothetical protein
MVILTTKKEEEKKMKKEDQLEKIVAAVEDAVFGERNQNAGLRNYVGDCGGDKLSFSLRPDCALGNLVYMLSMHSVKPADNSSYVEARLDGGSYAFSGISGEIGHIANHALFEMFRESPYDAKRMSGIFRQAGNHVRDIIYENDRSDKWRVREEYVRDFLYAVADKLSE